jgi:hypothetical protein
MKFKIIEKSRVIEQTIEFVFEHEEIKYIGRINDNGNGNTMWLLDQDENEINSGDVYEAFNNMSFDDWRPLENSETIDTEDL